MVWMAHGRNAANRSGSVIVTMGSLKTLPIEVRTARGWNGSLPPTATNTAPPPGRGPCESSRPHCPDPPHRPRPAGLGWAVLTSQPGKWLGDAGQRKQANQPTQPDALLGQCGIISASGMGWQGIFWVDELLQNGRFARSWRILPEATERRERPSAAGWRAGRARAAECPQWNSKCQKAARPLAVAVRSDHSADGSAN